MKGGICTAKTRDFTATTCKNTNTEAISNKTHKQTHCYTQLKELARINTAYNQHPRIQPFKNITVVNQSRSTQPNRNSYRHTHTHTPFPTYSHAHRHKTARPPFLVPRQKNSKQESQQHTLNRAKTGPFLHPKVVFFLSFLNLRSRELCGLFEVLEPRIGKREWKEVERTKKNQKKGVLTPARRRSRDGSPATASERPIPPEKKVVAGAGNLERGQSLSL